MTVLATALFALVPAMVLWSYVLYPALTARLAQRAAAPTSPGQVPASVEVLISAADEERVIAERVANLLGQEVGGSYRVAIGCDGSSDQTAIRARSAGDSRVRVIEFPDRRGKAVVLNDLVASSQAEVLVFTDANTRFDPGAVASLTGVFGDAAVGAACGRLVLEGSDPERVFWERETLVKRAEGRLGVCLGANGAIYAARRREVEPLPADTTSMDDFLIPVRIARRGLRIVFVEGAVAREEAPRDACAEMGRRFRIGVGAGQVLRRERWLWNVRRRGWLSLAFVSRKAMRWLAPVAAIAACVAACFSRALWPIGISLSAVLLLLALSARARPRPAGFFGRLYYFGVINLALGAGLLAGLLGYRRPVWKPVSREA